jgi:molybdopterin synthase catalytic subunit
METLAIAGPPAERDALAARFREHLDGRVGVVRAEGAADADGGPALDAAVAATPGGTEYAVGPDGDWTASGSGLTVDGAVERLAADHAHALVLGGDPDLPTVALGGADPAGEVVLSTADVAAVDDSDLDAAADAARTVATLASLVAAVERRDGEQFSGAIATFTGRVRAREGPDDPPTAHLEFERYDGVAAERMAAIREDLEEREGVHAVATHHRTGVVEAGEHIVHVVVLAGHRGEAFETVSDGIDRLKDEVPLFKREVTADEEFWVHDRE